MSLTVSETEEKFNSFLNRGESPFDYERKLIIEYRERVKSILRGENIPPYELEIQPSPYCNAGCVHCWAKDFSRLENRLSEKGNVDRVIEQVLSFEKNGFRIDNVKFCGSTGEPLVNPLTIYMINQFYNKRNIILFTNGVMIGKNYENDEYIGDLSKANRIIVSLDAGTTETLWRTKPKIIGTGIKIEDILEGIRRIKKSSKRCNIDVGYVITEHNYQEIVEAVRKAKEHGADNMKIRIDMVDREISSDKYKDEVSRLLEEAKEYRGDTFGVISIHSKEEIGDTDEKHFSTRGCGFTCFNSHLWSCVGSDGCLYPCGHIVDKRTKNYGSLLEQDFRDIWEGERRRRVVESLPVEKCSICSPSSLRRNRFLTFLETYSNTYADKLIDSVKDGERESKRLNK
jgi:radical SAM protein with 4Fe4S-binding SPASM domain